MTGKTPAASRQHGRAPVVGVLFDPALRPNLSDLADLARHSAAYAVTHHDAVAGLAELMRDGLTFDCDGLAPAPQRHLNGAVQSIALPTGFTLAGHALVTIAPGEQIGGAAQALPVVRGMAALTLALAQLPGVEAVVWLPARLVMSSAWFAEAVGIWLNGGPFPALALTALARTNDALVSKGLSYFVGQDLVFTGKDGILRESDARGAVRLIDWLVAHGRVDTACEVELPGFGTVLIVPEGQNTLRAHTL